MQIILAPFSYLMLFLYNFLNSYGLALIAFSLITKLILFPFSLKGKRSMIQMNMLQGKMLQLQKQYGRDRERYNMEVQKLYEKEKVNPMSGCLWNMLPMLVLVLLYFIIRQPVSYLMHISSNDLIEQIATITGVANTGAYPQIAMARAMNDPGTLAAVQSALGDAGKGLFSMNFDFLGIDLSVIPNWRFWSMDRNWSENFGPFCLVLISIGLSLVSMLVSQKTNKVNQSGNAEQQAQMNRMNIPMMIMMPVMSGWIGFIMPAGLCVYWIANNVFTMLQEVICARILKKDYAKAEAARLEQERLEKEEIKRKKEERAARIAAEQEEAKKNKGKKKPASKPQQKKKESTTEEGRVGIRPYARGRSYDVDRYGGVTEYHEPDQTVPEAAASEKKKKKDEKEPKAIENTAPETQETAQSQDQAGAGEGAAEDTGAEAAGGTPEAETPAQPAADEAPAEEGGQEAGGESQAEEAGSADGEEKN